MTALQTFEVTCEEISLGQLVGRVLVESGIEDLFSIPGDFTMQLSRELLATPGLRTRTMSHEYGTTLAALGYAVAKGVPGAVCFTYGVGVLNATNAIAQAYVERVPLVVISGSPGSRERQAPVFLHHTVVDDDSQLRIMAQVTAYQVQITDPHLALEQLREAVAQARQHSKPVYVEIPRDLYTRQVRYVPRLRPVPGLPAQVIDDVARQAAQKAWQLLATARHPVLVPGLEVKRAGQGALVLDISEQLGMPWVSTPMSRGAMPMDHPLFRGIHAGPASPSALTRKLVADCDVLVLLGEPNSDVNMGIASQIPPGRLIHAWDGRVQVGREQFQVGTAAFVAALVERVRLESTAPRVVAPVAEADKAYLLPPAPHSIVALDTPLTPFDVINELNRHFVQHPDTDLVADCGDSFFMSLGMFPADVLTSSLYMSMGIGVPGAIGYQLGSGKRPIVLVGDGAFHMTGNELMHAERFGTNPIVIVLNNNRWISLSGNDHDGALTDQRHMDFVVGARFLQVQAFTATTAQELRSRLSEACALDKPVLIDAKISPQMRSYLCERFFDAVMSQQHLPKR